MLKAVREAKLNSSWVNPHPDYEEALSGFVAGPARRPEQEPSSCNDFLPFQRRVARFGMLNSLSQVLLKLTSPGVPDLYQGSELWDFSLVDPDNRRPVDYERRRSLLSEVQALGQLPAEECAARVTGLLEHMEDGRIKLYVTWRALQLRRERAALFRDGAYLSLLADGARAEHVVAYARRAQREEVVVCVPRLYVALLGARQTYRPDWGDTSVDLPVGASQRYRNVLTGELIEVGQGAGRGQLRLAEICARFPLALLVPEPLS